MAVTQVRKPAPARHRNGGPASPSRMRLWAYRFDTKHIPYLLIAPFFLLFGVWGLFRSSSTAVVALRTWA